MVALLGFGLEAIVPSMLAVCMIEMSMVVANEDDAKLRSDMQRVAAIIDVRVVDLLGTVKSRLTTWRQQSV